MRFDNFLLEQKDVGTYRKIPPLIFDTPQFGAKIKSFTTKRFHYFRFANKCGIISEDELFFVEDKCYGQIY